VTTASLAFAGGSRHDGDGKVQIPQVTLQHRGQDADLDLGASGPSIGARFVFSANLVRNGKRVGVGAGDCVIVLFRPGPDPQGEPEALTDQGVATLSLPKGQITAQGSDHRAGAGRPDRPLPIRLAITGGTGAYRTAHGELLTSGPNEQGDERLTVRLIL
jgi:hypothetical protein